MDEQNLRRVEGAGALLVAIAYFLPWASIMTPLGSIELRGLYVDYAWILLILAISHLLLQLTKLNKEILALPATSLKYVEVFWRVIPFAFVGFFAWYGANFAFNARNASSEGHVTIFGTSVDSIVKAGLDYGYWIGVCGTVLLVAGVGLLSQHGRKFAIYAVVIAVAASGLAFGFSRPGKMTQQAALSASPEGAGSSATASVPVPTSLAEPNFDASPYVQMTSISARRLAKDYEASRYSNSIVISPIFRNVGSSTIVGLRGHLAVIDGFGNEVYGFNFRNDDKILPAHDSARGGYSFEENQFEQDDPYHKMIPLIEAETAKYTVKINHIAFEDGTVLPKK